MATRKEFCDAMNEAWKNHSMYVGTANGERTLDIAGKFFEMEKNYGRRDKDGNPLWYSDAARDYEYLAKCYRQKFDMTKSLAGDCSGIVVGILRSLNVISKTADYNCRTFMKACSKMVEIKDLEPGDLVFNKRTEPSHMAVYVGGDMVVESQGRDAGVVKRKTSEGGWAVGGRLDWFTPEEIPVLTRNLKYVEGDLMRGEDVGMAQERLKLHKCDPGKIDGVFGYKTREAVISFQTKNGLTVDGIIGQATWNALWQ